MKSRPFYKTKLGRAYLGDALAIMAEMADDSVDLIVTSPHLSSDLPEEEALREHLGPEVRRLVPRLR